MLRAGSGGRRNQQGGFTLFELLAVLGIMSLVLAFGLASGFGDRLFRPGTAGVKSVAHRSAAIIRDARARAINHNLTTSVIIDLGQHTISADGLTDRVHVPTNISLTVTAASSQRVARQTTGIRFFPNGSSTGGTLKYEQGQTVYRVQVNWLTGRVSVEQGR